MSRSIAHILVIGGGPAGYTAAIRAAQLGLRATCIDERSSAGGTCLHVGCIPSKAILASSERFARARSELADHGIEVDEPSLDLETLMRRKQAAVDELTHGVDGLLEKHGVEHRRGRASLVGGGRVRVVSPESDEETLDADHVLIATGSVPAELPGLPSEHPRILTSDDALSLDRVPERLAVVGGGYIGLELGSVWQRLGARVTIVEREERLLPQLDPELAEHAQQRLEEQGLEVRTRRAVEAFSERGDDLMLDLADPEEEGDVETLSFSHALVAVGRTPATEGLGLEAAGVECDDSGFVRIDARFRTTRPGVYAIGDVAREPMLAHKGQLEAIACVEAIAGRGSGWVDYDAIPAVVYTWPEIATLGRTERQLDEAGVRYRVGRADFRHDARALCTGEAVGFVKLLVEDGSGMLLGAHLTSPHAGSLIHELVLARTLGASIEEVARSPHAHPTLNETLREAALDGIGRSLHQ